MARNGGNLQFHNHKKARQVLLEVDRNPSNYLIIHYSCESFYRVEDGRTPRITSIAVLDFVSGQVASFSIHKTAEILGIPYNEISSSYDNIERKMLDEYFYFVERHLDRTWIHLNMRDLNYGFAAIEHRYQVLGGEPIIVPDGKKIDLGRLLSQFYGDGYAAHPHMDNLIAMNGITRKDYLTGGQEADAFENREYNKLHLSTLRKVQVLESIVRLAAERKLKVDTKQYQWYGLSPQGIFEMMKDTWWGWAVTCVLSAFVGAWVNSIF